MEIFLECPILVFHKNNAHLSKSNNIREAISGKVGQTAEILVKPPAFIITEFIENHGGQSEYSVVVLGQQDACLTKSNDISVTSLSNISHVMDVFIDMPTCVIYEIPLEHLYKIIESVSVVLSNADMCVAKHDNIIETSASDICKEADMFVIRIDMSFREVGRWKELFTAEASERDFTISFKTDNMWAT